MPSSELFSRFPHVLNKLAAAWGDVGAMAELVEGDLLIDSRGDRSGFPFGVLSEIQNLYTAHQALYDARGARQYAYWVSTQ